MDFSFFSYFRIANTTKIITYNLLKKQADVYTVWYMCLKSRDFLKKILSMHCSLRASSEKS